MKDAYDMTSPFLLYISYIFLPSALFVDVITGCLLEGVTVSNLHKLSWRSRSKRIADKAFDISFAAGVVSSLVHGVPGPQRFIAQPLISSLLVEECLAVI